MSREVLRYLEPENKHLIVDGTVGGGGHAELLLQNAGPQCHILGIDRDAEILQKARNRLAPFGDRVTLVHGNYSELGQILTERGFGPMDALLLDLGMSSFQVDTPERGFSFQKEGPLDMRMDRQQSTTAQDLLETYSDNELARILREYGEEKQSKQIVRTIRKAQGQRPIKTTRQLAQILSSAARASRNSSIHPATRSFQALRIAVNDEMHHLETALEVSTAHLKPGGRMAMISFHSLEDRRVKQWFTKEQKGCICPPQLPVCACGKKPRLKTLTRRVVLPGQQEVADNPRASSARLRAAERVAHA